MDAVVCKNSIYIDLDLYPNLGLNSESRSIYINMKKDVKRLFVWYRIFDILLSNYFMTSSSCVIVHTRYISRKTFQLFLNNWIFAIMKKKKISYPNRYLASVLFDAFNGTGDIGLSDWRTSSQICCFSFWVHCMFFVTSCITCLYIWQVKLIFQSIKWFWRFIVSVRFPFYKYFFLSSSPYQLIWRKSQRSEVI